MFMCMKADSKNLCCWLRLDKWPNAVYNSSSFDSLGKEEFWFWSFAGHLEISLKGNVLCVTAVDVFTLLIQALFFSAKMCNSLITSGIWQTRILSTDFPSGYHK